MLIRLDKLICRYASVIIRIADFFGLDRYRLVFLWIFIASAVLAIPIFTIFATIYFVAAFLITVAFFLQFANIHICAMQYVKYLTGLIGESPPQKVTDTARTCRVVSLFMLMAVSFIYIRGGEVTPLWPILVPLKLLLPLHLWMYFVDEDEDKRNKVRLRSLLKSAMKRIREMLLPNPAPSPAPV